MKQFFISVAQLFFLKYERKQQQPVQINDSNLYENQNQNFHPEKKIVIPKKNVIITKGVPVKNLTKFELVKQHLIEFGTIDSWTAITLYKATRLSGIIYVLKHTHGYEIESIISKDKTHFATYVLKQTDK
jgi:hypothetical protein